MRKHCGSGGSDLCNAERRCRTSASTRSSRVCGSCTWRTGRQDSGRATSTSISGRSSTQPRHDRRHRRRLGRVDCGAACGARDHLRQRPPHRPLQRRRRRLGTGLHRRRGGCCGSRHRRPDPPVAVAGAGRDLGSAAERIHLPTVGRAGRGSALCRPAARRHHRPDSGQGVRAAGLRYLVHLAAAATLRGRRAHPTALAGRHTGRRAGVVDGCLLRSRRRPSTTGIQGRPEPSRSADGSRSVGLDASSQLLRRRGRVVGTVADHPYRVVVTGHGALPRADDVFPGSRHRSPAHREVHAGPSGLQRIPATDIVFHSAPAPIGTIMTTAVAERIGYRPMTEARHGSELDSLLRRVARHDADAFAALYDHTRARVYGLITRVLRDSGYSEETTQEVYLEVWRTAEAYDSAKGSALSWLMTMAHRRAIDRVRAEQSASQRESRYGAATVERPGDLVADSAIAADERRRVAACLDSLTDVQRQCIELDYYGGLTYAEVSQRLSANLSTIKSRMRDALRGLRGCLGVT